MKYSRILLLALPLAASLAASGASYAEQKPNECKRGGSGFQNPCRPPHNSGTDCLVLPPDANRVPETGDIGSNRVNAAYTFDIGETVANKTGAAKSKRSKDKLGNCPPVRPKVPEPAASPSSAA